MGGRQVSGVGPLGPVRGAIINIRFLFITFNTAILIPLLINLSPSATLFATNVNALVFRLIAGKGIPVFLKDDFTFITPVVGTARLCKLPNAVSNLITIKAICKLVDLLIQ